MMEQHIDIIDRHGRKRRARPGETLRDGERFTMQFMDEEARAVADHLASKYQHPAPTADAMITDAAGAMAGHRPGFLYSNADCATLADAETTTAYEARNQRLSSAWKRKPEDANNLPAPGEQEAAWQRRQMLARKATVATMGKDAAPQARALADQAREERDERLRNSWRRNSDA